MILNGVHLVFKIFNAYFTFIFLQIKIAHMHHSKVCEISVFQILLSFIYCFWGGGNLLLLIRGLTL